MTRTRAAQARTTAAEAEPTRRDRKVAGANGIVHLLRRPPTVEPDGTASTQHAKALGRGAVEGGVVADDSLRNSRFVGLAAGAGWRPMPTTARLDDGNHDIKQADE